MIINHDSIISVHYHSHAPSSAEVFKLNDSADNIDVKNYVNQSEYCRDLDVYIILFNIPTGLSDPINKYIPEEIINKIHKKEIFLVIYSPIESTYRYIDLIYDNYINKYLIPESQIIFVGGSPDYESYIIKTSKKYQKDPIKLELYYPLIRDIRGVISNYYGTDSIVNLPSPLKKNKTNKKFLFLNHRPHPHRVSVLCLLNNKNLIDQGHISFSNYISEFKLNLEYAKKHYTSIEEELNNGSTIIDRLPFKLDELPFNLDYRKFLYIWSPIIHKYYNDSYFSIVAETIFSENSPIMFTEKILKCMVYKHPFILVSKSKTLKLLRNLGFKTFNGMINESYDDEVDYAKRLTIITDEVARLCAMKDKDLQDFKEYALEIVEFNYKHLWNINQLVFKIL